MATNDKLCDRINILHLLSESVSVNRIWPRPRYSSRPALLLALARRKGLRVPGRAVEIRSVRLLEPQRGCGLPLIIGLETVPCYRTRGTAWRVLQMRMCMVLMFLILLAMPTPAAEFVSIEAGKTPPAPSRIDVACTSSQGATFCDHMIGIQGTFGPQGSCISGNPGDPGDLVGFAWALASCQDGWVVETRVLFAGDVVEPGDEWQLYLWRDLGGIPFDACGLECGVANNPLTMSAGAPGWESYDWTIQYCPCITFAQETLYIGTVYVNGVTPLIGSWRATSCPCAGPAWDLAT